jgi:membrane protease YdiL (CAAX protease family)
MFAVGVLLLPIGAALRSILLAPLFEEAVFRLGVHDALAMHLPRDKARLAPALTALAFAGLHLLLAPGVLAWPLAAATAVPAWWIGMLYERKRRLGTCVAWHAGFNLVWLGGFRSVVPALAGS